MTGPDHYEVELRELLYESDGTGGLRVTGSMWKPVRVFDKGGFQGRIDCLYAPTVGRCMG